MLRGDILICARKLWATTLANTPRHEQFARIHLAQVQTTWKPNLSKSLTSARIWRNRSPTHAETNSSAIPHHNHGVAVFWDYESLPLTAADNEVAGQLVKDLTQIAKRHGDVQVLKAFLDRTRTPAPRSIAVLDYSGVTVVDCPHNGRKEVVDKRIQIDIFEYMLDNPGPATIILITADGGYGHAISRVLLRGYSVVLVAPPTAQRGDLSITEVSYRYSWPDLERYRLPWQDDFPFMRTSKQLPEDGMFFTPALRPPGRIAGASMQSARGFDESALNQGPVSPEFLPLYNVLVNLHKGGVDQVNFVTLASSLMKLYPDAYKQARVKNFTRYMIVAEKEKIVLWQEIGGRTAIPKENYVALHPRLLQKKA
ncbi:hypothetical protein WOLCODRAFT_136820 [Wolfiporia cocos MD-104 SS10]|uniref:NYN domain-containing protein n=1 Tax=Wolfiporia cocos (strain MD-104) TaxID=742152 RepID=A0A2H3JEP8_WOLCO|nr:hypothetical protein WOLCODRAFT_136820 [Wolfiporia cocos MD-104 SS10]